MFAHARRGLLFMTHRAQWVVFRLIDLRTRKGSFAAALTCSAAAWFVTLPDGNDAGLRADWERRWITSLDPGICTTKPVQTSRFIDAAAEQAFSMAGGSLELDIDAATGRVRGIWTLRSVHAPWGWLHLQAPPGFTLRAARVAQTSLAVDIKGGHMAVALDACAREACDVALDFSVDTGAAPTSGWPVERLLPRLGLDGDRLLRNTTERERQGLPARMTLPPDLAAVAVAGVAPAGDWQWQARIRQGTSSRVIQGKTQGALDFVLLSSGGAAADHLGMALADEARSMQACVAARMGGVTPVREVVLAPAGASPWMPGLAGVPGARLSAGTLWLPQPLREEPALRRAEMARAIALRYVADTGRLRQAQGAQWLASGLPGAIALLCVADQETPVALQTLLQRASAQATRAVQTQAADVGAVAFAAFDGWVRDYAPLAALDTVRHLRAEQIQTLLSELGSGVRIQYALSHAMGTPRATLALSMPLATDLRVDADGNPHGERWRWVQGRWKQLTELDGGWTLAESAADGALWLAAWPGYERNFADNFHAPKAPVATHALHTLNFAGERP